MQEDRPQADRPLDLRDRCKAFVVLSAEFAEDISHYARCEVGDGCAVSHLRENQDRWIFAHAGVRTLEG